MKRYRFVFLSYLKFLAIFVLIITLFASCGTDDQDLVDVDVEVNIGTTVSENNGTQIFINSGDVYINQGTNSNIPNDDVDNTITTLVSTTTVSQKTTTQTPTITTNTETTSQISNDSTITQNSNANNTLNNDNVELIVHSTNSCTGYISNDYITKYYIGRKSGDFKTIGWSIYMKTDTDSMAIAVEIDWEDEKSENLRAVGIYQNEGTIQNGIDFSLTDEGLFIELNSNNLPFDLYEVNYIEIQNISEII